MIKASEFCVSVFDGTHESPKPTKEGYKLLTSKNILNGYIDSSDAYFISEQDYNSINERSKIYKWDILFSMIGTVGNICLITEEKLDFAIKNMGVFSTRNEEKAKWLYFYLKSPIVKRKIQNQLNGAVQKFLPLGWLRNLELPEYKEDHKRIVDLLWSIEEKINKNNSINLELESMTKTIYDYWFLQFEFPNEKRMPYKSSGGKMVWNEDLKKEIPDGWMVKKFGDLIIENEKSKIQVGDARIIKGDYPFFTSGDDILRVNQAMVEGMNIYLNTGGNANVNFYNGKAAYSTDTWCIKGKNNLTNYLALYLLSIKEYLFTKFFHGTGLKHLQKSLLKNEVVLVPNEMVLFYLNKIVDPISRKIELCLAENYQLVKLRDFLLPLLMNGQITFKDLDL